MTINANTLSNDINLTVTNYIFVDDCSTDKTSNYNILSLSDNKVTFSFDTDKYKLQNTADNTNVLKLPNLALPNHFIFEVELNLQSNVHNTQNGLGLINNSDFYGIRYIKNNRHATYYAFINSSDVSSDDLDIGTKTGTWIKWKLEYNNGTVTYKIMSTDETTTYYTLTKTSIPTPTTVGIFNAWDNGAIQYIRNIKVEEI